MFRPCLTYASLFHFQYFEFKISVLNVFRLVFRFPDSTMIQYKQFSPKETLVFIRMVKYALQALDIYTVQTTAGSGQAFIRSPQVQTVRTKEEKEVLEHFAGVVSRFSFSYLP